MSGPNLAVPYGVAVGLVVTASVGWPVVLVFAVAAGGWIGWTRATPEG